MEEELNFKISQFIDNDLPVEEALSLLDRMEKQPDLCRKLHQYEAISQAMQTDVFFRVDEDFINRINKEVENENVLTLPRKRRIRGDYKTVIAIAASVSIIAIIILGGLSESAKQNFHLMQLAVKGEQAIDIQQQTPAPSEPVNPRYYNYLDAHQGSLHASLSPFHNHARVIHYGQQ